MNTEPHNDAMECDRYDHRLEDQRNRRGNVQMRRILNQRLPGDRRRQHHGMERVNIKKRIEPVLIKFEQTHQDQRSSKQMRDIEVDAVHQKLPDTKRSSVANNPSISAAPRNSGTRNTRILAIEVSNSAISTPPTASLAM